MSYMHVVHEKLVLELDFEKCFLKGFAELTCNVVKPLKDIRLHARQISILRVLVNEIEALFDHDHPLDRDLLPRRPVNGPPDAAVFNGAYQVAQEISNEGDLSISIPDEVLQEIEETLSKGEDEPYGDLTMPDPFKMVIKVYYELPESKGGVRWVRSAPHLSAASASYMYTDLQAQGARLWMPCMDRLTDRYTWDIHVTAPAGQYVVCSGRCLKKIAVERKDVANATGDLPVKYEYTVEHPTPAQGIGLLVGPFQEYRDPNAPAFAHVAMPHHMPSVVATCSFFPEVVRVLEEYLGCTLGGQSSNAGAIQSQGQGPHNTCPSYYNVFLDDAYDSASFAANMSIFSSGLLHTDRAIEQVFRSRTKIALNFISSNLSYLASVKSWSEWWVMLGASGFLCNEYVRQAFGNNEHKWRLYQQRQRVFDRDDGSVVLGGLELTHPTDASSKVIVDKATVLFHVLEKRVGSEPFRKVMRRIFAVDALAPADEDGNASAERRFALLSSKSLVKTIKRVTGVDLKTFEAQFIQEAGCLDLQCVIWFNRKKHVTELVLKQATVGRPERKATGPLTVRVHETEGTYDHLVSVDDDIQDASFACHSRLRKMRKLKRPKYQLANANANANNADGNADDDAEQQSNVKLESAILWVRIDPEMEWLVRLNIRQPEPMWARELLYDKDIIGQIQAIDGLRSIGSSLSSKALFDSLQNAKVFYAVRIHAAHSMAAMSRAETSWTGLAQVIGYFRSKYFDQVSATVRPNDFRDFSDYFVQKGLLSAISLAREANGSTHSDSIDFLMHIAKYNDNSDNQYDDGEYIARLLESLAQCTYASDKTRNKVRQQVIRYVQLDKLAPSHCNRVTCAGIKALTALQKPTAPDWSILEQYAQVGNYYRVRLQALASSLVMLCRFLLSGVQPPSSSATAPNPPSSEDVINGAAAPMPAATPVPAERPGTGMTQIEKERVLAAKSVIDIFIEVMEGRGLYGRGAGAGAGRLAVSGKASTAHMRRKAAQVLASALMEDGTNCLTIILRHPHSRALGPDLLNRIYQILNSHSAYDGKMRQALLTLYCKVWPEVSGDQSLHDSAAHHIRLINRVKIKRKMEPFPMQVHKAKKSKKAHS
mmetsp:Transcript_36976/g.59846  ORF Transcript_36976/g.59846 Transcript_36976/m.59846 type:complete len:1107 (+) Transcript_36976:80-3400(+)